MSHAQRICATRPAMASPPQWPSSRPARPPQAAATAIRALREARGKDFRRALDRLLDTLDHPESRGRIDPSLLLEAEPPVEDYFANGSGAILANEIVWSDEDQAFADWAIRARERWAALASEFASQEVAAIGAASPVAARLLAMALASLGDGIRWRAIAGRGRGRLQPLHRAYRLATAAGIARTAAPVRINGESVECTPESLYIRALLFDALCAGALSRQELVVADALLLLWARDFVVLDRPPAGGRAAAIGIVGDGGLEPLPAVPGEPVTCIGGLEGLPDRIAAVRSAFHEGRLVAGAPVAALVPIEHHVSALGRLEELLAYWADPVAARERRSRASAGRSVPIHVGLGDILARGFGPAVEAGSTDGGDSPVASPGSARAERRESYGMPLQPIGLRAIVEDLSTRGMGLSPADRDGAPSTGDLVGARLGSMLRVGRVVRCFADPTTHRLRIGVSVLADNPARVELANAAPEAPFALTRVQALFVPGTDPGGDDDALIVPRAAFDAAATWELALGGETYLIRLGRDRVCGRGWVVARYEVQDARASQSRPMK